MLVTGADPIGLFAAMIGKHQGLDVHVLDRISTGGNPDLARLLETRREAPEAFSRALDRQPDDI